MSYAATRSGSYRARCRCRRRSPSPTKESTHSIWREFYRQVDLRVVDLWKKGDFRTFIAMLPEYAKLCEGEGGMHDTAMLLGALGWDTYAESVEIVTDYFASSGTGQINAIFPVHPDG